MSLMDFPNLIANALGTTELVGGLILSVAVLTMVGLALSMARMDILPTILILFAVGGLLTAIGWLGIWFLILSGLTVASLFGVKVAREVQGGA